MTVSAESHENVPAGTGQFGRHASPYYVDETLARLSKRGARLVGEVVQYGEACRLCYIRGPEGLLIGLAEELR